MMQDEYEALVGQIETLKNEMNKQKEIFEKTKNKITNLKSMMGKCDLAWRTLFTNKTWNDIQLKATTDKQRFTRGKDDDELEKDSSEPEKDSSEPEKDSSEPEKDSSEPEKDSSEPEKDSSEPDKESTKALAKYKNNPLKKLWNKIKEKFSQVKNIGKQEKQVSNEEPETSKVNTNQRDEFLEGLRKHVDVEYGKIIRESKEQEYMQEHRAKRTQESQGREPGDD